MNTPAIYVSTEPHGGGSLNTTPSVVPAPRVQPLDRGISLDSDEPLPACPLRKGDDQTCETCQ
ncbi:MAG: hypothetical protein HYX47_10155 [Burkholderiales bacterium]|nr:hypothetical protein [Burkholderiales bacterium]